MIMEGEIKHGRHGPPVHSVTHTDTISISQSRPSLFPPKSHQQTTTGSRQERVMEAVSSVAVCAG